MRIVIVGAGEVGFNVARSLSQDGHDVVVVEENQERFSKVSEELDVMTVEGNGSRPMILERAGVAPGGSTDMLIACTNRDEVNILACWIAKQAGVPKVIARAVGLEFTDSPEWGEKLGIDMMVSPERSVAYEVDNLLRARWATHSMDVASGAASIYAVPIREDCPSLDLSLAEIRERHRDLIMLVVYIKRGDRGFIPNGRDRLKRGDLCYCLCYKGQTPMMAGVLWPPMAGGIKRAFVVGGGKVGFQVSRRLASNGVSVKLIDHEREKCKRLSRELERVDVIWGDGSDEGLLLQEGIDSSCAFISTTGSDENNIILSVLGKNLGAAKSIGVVKKRSYLKMAGILPIDSLVNRNMALSDLIITSVRYPQGNERVSLLEDIGAELVETVIPTDSPSAGKTLMELDIPQGAVIGMITRGDSSFIPNGLTRLMPHDQVVVFSEEDKTRDVLASLGVRED
ncbi:K+ transport system, NAD-binding component [Thermanaerovibrio velox DSM 12556]|uniref:Trk system potassium uptake protein TrkA n=1 Tax=Thermanaerovibrio velox DSM 12556 TaxID=926567 RepID=H0UQP7_9BACT|nr:Trk system potassium transporter TrkA [Thermanaerovibrio velox]EHM10811.1 K+ transport system, NAD-binding component [Thermanaerovibrio velox DSM 12556]